MGGKNNQQQSSFEEKDGDKVVIEQLNECLVELVINRVEKMNALDLHVLEILVGAIKTINFQALVISGRGDRAFSAGGDIITIYQNLQKQNGKYLEDYLKARYTLEYELEKLSLLEDRNSIIIFNGMCVGGGYSLALHSNYRICTETTLINFPECQNGTAIPCIKFLASLEKQYLVRYMILTGSSLKGQELVYAGLADYIIPSNKIKMFKNSLKNLQNISKLNEHILKYTIKLKNASQIVLHENFIQKYFSGDNLLDILKKLEQGLNEWAEEDRLFCKRCLSKIQRASPLAIRANFEMILKAADLSEQQAYNLNHRVQYRLFNHKDFQEAVYVKFEQNKRNIPVKWQHKNILEVSQQQIDTILSPLKEPQLQLK
ncbi:hypothetical protein ABPG74_012661 [Tetrahymena malaccensis]